MKEKMIMSAGTDKTFGEMSRLTRQPQTSYAEYSAMSDPQDQVEKKSSSEQTPKQTTENRPNRAATEAQEQLKFAVSRIEHKLKKIDQIDLKDFEAEDTGLKKLIQEVYAFYPRKEAKVVIKPARKVQKKLRNIILLKRAEKKGDKTEKKEEKPTLLKKWFRRFTQEELDDKETSKLINKVVAQGQSPTLEDDEEMKENTALPDRARIEKAEEILEEVTGKEIDLSGEDEETKAKREAILKAHEVGAGDKDEDGNAYTVYNYTVAHLKKKNELLEQAGFSEKERDALIIAGLVGEGEDEGVIGDLPETHIPEGEKASAADPNAARTETAPSPTPSRAEVRRMAANPYNGMNLDQLVTAQIGSPQDILHMYEQLKAINAQLVNDPSKAGIDIFKTPEYKRVIERLNDAKELYPVTRADSAEFQRMYGGGEVSPNYNPADRELYEGPVSDRIIHLMDRIDNDNYSVEDKIAYYKNLKRYMNYILENAYDPKDPDNKEKQLHLDPKVKERLEQMFKQNTEELWDPEAPDTKIRENVRYLHDEVKLQDYFSNLADEREGKTSRYLPNSIDEVCELVAQNYGNEFRTGGKYELINTYNEFQVQNFLQFIRLRMKDQDDGNPNSDIDLLNGIQIQAEMSRVSLMDIILTPRYTSRRKIRLSNVDTRGNVVNKVTATLTPTEEDADLKQGKWIFLREAWMFQLNHNFDAGYRQVRGVEDQVPEALMKFFRNSDFTGDSRILKLFKLSANDLEEFRQYRDYEKEGEVGKAMRQMVLAYNYLAHFAENENRDADTNMFMKVMGPEGMKAFYNSLASDALSSNMTMKDNYKAYVLWMLQQQKQKTTDKDMLKLIDDKITDVKKIEMTTSQDAALLKTHNKVKKDELNIRLDYMSEIEEIRFKMRERELRKKLEKEDKDKVRDEIRKEVAESIDERFLSHVKTTYQEKADKRRQEMLAETDKEEKEKIKEDYERLQMVANASSHFTDDKEKFALDLVKGLLYFKMEDLNFFNSKKPYEALEKMVKKAIENGACRQRDMNDDDAAYAGMWAWRFRNWTGIAARNDTKAVGFDAWSKIMNFEDYRIRQEEERSGAGNRHTIPGLKRMSLTLWEGIDFRAEGTDKKVRLIDALQGGQGDKINLGNDVGKGSFELNAMSDFADTHLKNAMSLNKLIIEKMYMHLDKLVSIDPRGQLLINEEHFFEIKDTWWKNIRYTFDQLRFNYDKEINVWERVTKKDKKGDVVRNKKTGEADTELVFKTVKLRDYFFDHEVNHMGMYERFGKDPGKEDRMARNVWAYMIAKEIGHHIDKNRIHPAYTIDQLRMIQLAFERMAADVEREDEHGHRHIKVTNVMYTDKEFNKILKHAGMQDVSIGGLQLLNPFQLKTAQDVSGQVGTGLLGGLFAMIRSGMKAASPTGGGGGGGHH